MPLILIENNSEALDIVCKNRHANFFMGVMVGDFTRGEKKETKEDTRDLIRVFTGIFCSSYAIGGQGSVTKTAIEFNRVLWGWTLTEVSTTSFEAIHEMRKARCNNIFHNKSAKRMMDSILLGFPGAEGSDAEKEWADAHKSVIVDIFNASYWHGGSESLTQTADEMIRIHMRTLQ